MNMDYYKNIENGYIVSVGTGNSNNPIQKEEYNTIMSVIQNRPHAEGKGYRLRTDLTWEEYDLPPEPPGEDEVTLDDALDMLRELGVEV